MFEKFRQAAFEYREPIVASVKGALGISGTGGGIYMSMLPTLEAWLRVISLSVGIAVGLATLVSIVVSLKKRK